MQKLTEVIRNNKTVAYRFHCKGCGFSHIIYTDKEVSNIVWQFNGNLEKPTFKPSLLVYIPDDDGLRCHSFIRNGNIEYLNDCTHDLKGQTIELDDVVGIENRN